MLFAFNITVIFFFFLKKLFQKNSHHVAKSDPTLVQITESKKTLRGSQKPAGPASSDLFLNIFF